MYPEPTWSENPSFASLTNCSNWTLELSKDLNASKNLDAWNSLAVIGFMSLANEHYGVIVSPKDIAASKTVDDLLALTR